MEIIGILPGAGAARRIGGFPKPLSPMNIHPNDSTKFLVVSEMMIDNMFDAGAKEVYFVINRERNKIIEDFFVDYEKNLRYPRKLHFFNQEHTDEYYGMAFAIKAVIDNQAENKIVLLGMPDTLIEPGDAFQRLIANYRKHKTDLELGLFKINKAPEYHGGYIEYNSKTNAVIGHIDKLDNDYPWNIADNSWAIACWNYRFTKYIKNIIDKSTNYYRDPGFKVGKDFVFGRLIDSALKKNSGMKIHAEYVDFNGGYYLDISDPYKYFEAILHFQQDISSLTRKMSRKEISVFISYSNHDIARASDLFTILKLAGLDPKMDIQHIRAGNVIDLRIKRLIEKSEIFIVLVSNSSHSSEWVLQELEYANSTGMLAAEKVIPIQIEDMAEELRDSFPIVPFNNYNWHDGRNGYGNLLDILYKMS